MAYQQSRPAPPIVNQIMPATFLASMMVHAISTWGRLGATSSGRHLERKNSSHLPVSLVP